MFMSLFTVLNNNKNYKNGGAYWNRGAYLQKHILWGALIRKGALIGRRALNRIITVIPIARERRWCAAEISHISQVVFTYLTSKTPTDEIL